MDSSPDRGRPVAALFATALSALGWWFGYGLHPHAWLTWLAPLPVLLLATRVRSHWAVPAAFVAFAVGGCSQWHYLHGLIGLPLATILAVIAGPALVFALCVWLFSALLRRRRPLAAALSVPALWVGLAYLVAQVSPHGSFGDVGYTQMAILPVIQIAALTGIWGIDFVVMLVPATLAVLATPSARFHVAAVATVALAATLGYGTWRLHAPAPSTALRIGLVSLETPIRPPLDSPQGRTLVARYVTAIDRLAQRGARAVVIPEESVLATSATTLSAFADTARRDHLLLVAGIDYRAAPHDERNMSVVYRPDGAPKTYSKHHLIPGFEDRFTPGRRTTLLDGPLRIGLEICKDMDFPALSRAYGRLGAQLLAVPAWDFGADGWLHSRMAILRGVESGFAIARVARRGRLTLSDDRGRVLAEASSERHDAELLGSLPLRHTHTLYARWGNWFAWLVLVLLSGLLVLALRRPRATLSTTGAITRATPST